MPKPIKLNDNLSSIVTAPSLSNQVYGFIKTNILNGGYKPDHNLNEVEIAQSLKISRSPVREAIQILAKEGLVRIIPRRGAFVSRLEIEEINELCELREALEVFSIRAAATRATDEDLEELLKCLNATKSAIEGNNYTYYPLDFDFHLRIAMCAKNTKLEESIHRVNVQLALARYQAGRQVGRPASALKEHTEMFEALRNRDIALAESLMVQHLSKSRDNMITAFESI